MNRLLQHRPPADATAEPAARVEASASARAGAEGVPGARHALGGHSWIARNLQYLYLAYLLMYPLPWVVRRPDAIDVAAFALGVAVFLPAYFAGYQARSSRRLLLCSALILGIGFALQPFGGVWGVFAVYASALVAYLRPERHAVVALVVVGVAVLAFALLLGLHPAEYAFTLFFGALVGLGSLYQARIEYTNAQLAASRDEARRLAVVAERERIARDLHDVLGHTLTVVAVKADLAGKLVDRDPAAARREAEEIRDTARRALAELRSALTGMRSATLAAELAGAREALAAANVVHEIRVDAAALPPAVETALAYVLREAVTNVVRHAEASRCTIVLARAAAEACLEVADDGRGGARPEGSGIAGMRLRLAPLGGRLEVDGRVGTRVVARVPLTEAARGGATAGP